MAPESPVQGPSIAEGQGKPRVPPPAAVPVQGPSIAESEGKPRVAPAPTVPDSTSPAVTTLTPQQQQLAQQYQQAGLIPSNDPPKPQQAPPVGGVEDVIALTQHQPKDGQSFDLPSGPTVKDESVRLPNGLTGNEATISGPGLSTPVVSGPKSAISPQQAAGLFATDSAYTPEQRDRDLALLNGPRVQGPYTEAGLAAETAAKQAATARLNAHWNQSALPDFADGSTVLPGLGYSAAQLANDLSLASTTGTLDARSDQLRKEATARLALNAYTKQQQDDDQATAQLQRPWVATSDRLAEVRLLMGRGYTAEEARNTVLFLEARDARNRLAQAGIGLLTPEQAQQLADTPKLYPTDPRKSLIADTTPYDPDDDKYPNVNQGMQEADFRNLLGEFTGLNDLTEGIEDGNWGQAAFGGSMAVLTFVPGVGTLIGRGVGRAGRGIGNWAEKGLEAAPASLTAAEAALRAEAAAAGLSGFGAKLLPGASLAIPDGPRPILPDGIRPGELTPPGINPKPAQPGILEYPKADELPWNTQEAIPVPALVAPPHTIPPTRGPGWPINPWQKFDEWGLPVDMLEDPIILMRPKLGRPGTTMPRRSPGQHGNGTGTNPETGIPWTGKTGETPVGHWPVGVYRGPNNGQWYKKVPGQSLPVKVSMPQWAMAPSDVVMHGQLIENPIATIKTGLPGYEQHMLDEVNALQHLDKSARDLAKAGLVNLIDSRGMRLQLADGSFRKLTIEDLSKSNLEKSLQNLSGRYVTGEIEAVETLAKDLTINKGGVDGLSELRGEIGGDYFAEQVAGIKIVYRGSGPYTADRVGVWTDAAGNRRVVLLEYKGGNKPDSLSTRVVDPGTGEKINVEQGTLPYAQDEFLRPNSAALQALKDYDPKLAQQLLEGKDFDYLLVHTEPGTNKITAYGFDPGTAKAFTLKQPGIAPGAQPIAAEIPNGGAPWISDLMLSGLDNLNVWTALALPVLAPLTGLAWPANTDKKADQSMVVNISMPKPATTDVDPRETARVLTYSAHIR
ncbi:hypothetical protein ACFWPK_07545 [Nocardia sp. NPDC058519]|uniref:hypothetical protein n=1 Tax=Nocardia sp. NPDC058519 TaxID=3346535 RepID=UPI0036630A03